MGCVNCKGNAEDILIHKINQKYKDSDYNKIPKFIPNINVVYVVNVYDGDTITVVSTLNNGDKITPYRFTIRLNGIDCPEIKTKNELEKKHALRAKDFLVDMIYQKVVYLNVIKCDKYGRLLCDVFYNNINVNKLMIYKNYAIEYDGGTKKTFDDFLEKTNQREGFFERLEKK